MRSPAHRGQHERFATNAITPTGPTRRSHLGAAASTPRDRCGDRARVREQEPLAAHLSAARSAAATPLRARYRGPRPAAWQATCGAVRGGIGSSNVAFRWIKPDPATAIQAVTGSGLYDG